MVQLPMSVDVAGTNASIGGMRAGGYGSARA